MESRGIIPYLIDLKEFSIHGEIEEFLENSDILVLNIPPGLRSVKAVVYLKRLKNLLPVLENSTVGKVLFVSSTSVYLENVDFPLINEKDKYLSKSKKAKILVEGENYFFDNPKFQTTIIRLSGLLGKGRHPAKYLSGKSDIENPDSPVNLIHLDDAIGAIVQIITKNAWGEVFNASFPHHPSREGYYTKICEKLNLSKPHFTRSVQSLGKIISSHKIQEKLNFQFNNPID